MDTKSITERTDSMYMHVHHPGAICVLACLYICEYINSRCGVVWSNSVLRSRLAYRQACLVGRFPTFRGLCLVFGMVCIGIPGLMIQTQLVICPFAVYTVGT